jgi:uncharacterized membrane protein
MDTKLTIDFLNNLSDKLSGKAEQLFSILVKQTILIGKIDILVGIITLLLFVGSMIIILYVYKKYKESSVYDMWDVGLILVTVGGACCLVASVCCLTCGYLRLINPSYYAILKIISCM